MTGRGANRPTARQRRVAAAKPSPDAAPLGRIHEIMTRCRRFDRKMLNLQRQGRIRFFGSAHGEEAAVVASAAALRDDDWIFPALRQVGAMFWRGYPLWRAVAQNMGSAKDLLRGRQMPCHYSDREFHIVSWSSCIATQLTHAVGAARAAQTRGEDRIVLAYLGDGATSENDFHAALTFAGVWKVPCIFLCQNNHWAISVPRRLQTAAPSIAAKGDAYGIAGIQVDGNDAEAVYDAVRSAAGRARGGEGATLVEAVTYRLSGHSSSDDPTRYRDPDEVATWERKDPLPRLTRLLEARGELDAARLEALEARFDTEIDAAIREAESGGRVALSSLFEDVLSAAPPSLLRQRDAFIIEQQARASVGGPGEFPL